VQRFHCGLPRGLIHSVNLTLTGVSKSSRKVFKSTFVYKCEIERFDVGSNLPPHPFFMVVIIGLSPSRKQAYID